MAYWRDFGNWRPPAIPALAEELQEVELGIRTVVGREYGINGWGIDLEIGAQWVDFDTVSQRWDTSPCLYNSLLPYPIFTPTLNINIPVTTAARHHIPELREEERRRYNRARNRTFQILKGLTLYHPRQQVPGIPFDRYLLDLRIRIVDWAEVMDSPAFVYVLRPWPGNPITYEVHHLHFDPRLALWKQLWEGVLRREPGEIDHEIQLWREHGAILGLNNWQDFAE